MQQLSPDQAQRVILVLKNLYSSDNSVRSIAEEEFNSVWLKNQPQELAITLAQLCAQTEDFNLSSISCVLVRRLCFKPFAVPSIPKNKGTLWNNMNEASKELIKKTLLDAFVVQNPDPMASQIKNKLSDALAEIARISQGNWPALLDVILNYSSPASNTLPQINAILRIISTYPPIMRTISGSIMKDYFNSLLSDALPEELLVESVKAYVSFIQATHDNSTRSALCTLMNHILILLTKFTQNDSNYLLDILSALCELAEEYPKAFKGILGQLINLLYEIIVNNQDSFENSVRQSAVELYVTLCEGLPVLMKKSLQADGKMLRAIFERMLPEIEEDDEEWFNCEVLDNNSSSDENYAIAEQAIDRISLALGGEAVLPVAFEIIPRFIRSSKWEERRGALMSIAYLAEGCSSLLEGELENVLGLVFRAFQDPNQRVKYAACHTLGQLCTDFQLVLQETFHLQCMECLLGAMSSQNHSRIQTHAASALINFCDGCEPAILVPYMDSIVENLVNLFKSNKIYAQEQAITTLSVLADVSEEGFKKYYSSIMPLLIQIMHLATDSCYRVLRAKAIDAITLVALSVGRETFSDVANNVLETMIQIQKNPIASDDPINIYLPSAWVRICRIFESDFHPLMEIVWPSVIAAARLEPDIALLDADEELSEEQQSDDWEFSTIHGKKIGIKTSTLEEKCSAVENIQSYAEILGKAFAPFCGDVLKLLINLFSFEYHDGVKVASVSAVGSIFKCLLDAAKEKGMDLSLVLNQWYPVLTELTDSMAACEVEESDFLCQSFDTITQCIGLFGQGAIPSLETLHVFGQIINPLMKEITQNIQKAEMEASQDSECNGEIEDEAVENEENLLIEFSKFFRIGIQTYGMPFVECIREQLPLFSSGMCSTRSVLRHVSICIFGDIVEFGGDHSWQFANLFAEHMFHCLSDSVPEVRQAACYAIGVCALKGGSSYGSLCQAAIPRLFEMSKQVDARKSDNIIATENAISTLAKIFQIYNGFENEKLVTEWIQLLPVLQDEEEVENVYRYFMKHVQNTPTLSDSMDKVLFLTNHYIEAYLCDNTSASFKEELILSLRSFLSRYPHHQINALLQQHFPLEKLKCIPLGLN